MTTREHNIALPLDQIIAFCRRHPISKLSLFGSVLRDDFRETSDIDFLIQFNPGASVSYFFLAELEIELEKIVERKVDLRTPNELNQRLRQSVLDSAEMLYSRD